jgi:NADH-quinone oxidoreductase subunit L
VFAYLFYVPLGERVAGFWDRYAEVGATQLRPWSHRVPWLQHLLEHKYYFDELYNLVFVRPMDWLAVEGMRWVDAPVFDGSLDGVAAVVADGAGGLSLLENGYFRRYALVFLGGALVAGVLLLWLVAR